MQTIPGNPKLAVQAMHHLPNTQHVYVEPSSKPLGEPASTGSQLSSAASAPVQAGAFSELDAMLIGDPNTGAINGLRAAFLFNAGLALSGLLIWEIWTALAV